MAVVEALFAEARRKLAEAQRGPVQPVANARLPAPDEAALRAAVDLWLHAEVRKQRTEAPPDDPEAVADNLRTDEAHLVGPEGLDVASRRLPVLLQQYGLGAPPADTRSFAISLMRDAMVEAVARSLDGVIGRTGERVHNPAFSGVLGSSPPPPAPEPLGITFGELCVRYLSAPERAALAPKTVSKYRGMIRVLGEIFGAETNAKSIDRGECRRAQAVLMRMPKNAAQRYPGLTAQQAADAAQRDGVALLHANSIVNHLEFLASVFSWGAREKLLRLPDGNPAEGLNGATSKTMTAWVGEKRRPFTTDELHKIFSAPLYTGCQDDGAGWHRVGLNHPRRGRFWVPLLGLFAGLRLNEACQLSPDDVAVVDDVPVLLIRANAEGQRLKTSAANRRVPIHQELLRIGFLQLVARSRTAGEMRLFPELTVGKLGNLSDPFSKWFARFLEKAGVTSPGAVFHSFRHGFRDRMREAGVPSEVVDALGGWTTPGQAAAYGGGFSVPTLRRYISEISYPGLDLSHLHLSGDPTQAD
jgi:integrase